MQAPGDNSITVVESQTYADTNLNEKALGTQYIYTTEGQLIPTNDTEQHYSTVHVTEAQSIHIQQVDYHYEEQYPDGAVQQVVPISGTDSTENQQDTHESDQQSYVSEISADTETKDNQPDYTTEKPAIIEDASTTQVDNGYQAIPIAISEKQVDNNQKLSAPEIIETSHDKTTAVPEVTRIPVVEAENEIEGNEKKLTKPENVIEEVEIEQEVTENEETVNTPTITEDEALLDNLKSNAAIEIQHDESAESVEDVMETNEREDEEVEEIVIEESNEGNEKESANDDTEEGIEDVTIANTDSEETDPSYVSEIAAETEIEVPKKEVVKEEVVHTPKPRGRKPKNDIPLHILGHDVNKPVDTFVNGKTPKPRLGVKVPYRNLTSQIVSKAEIEKEIVERGRKKQELKQDLTFARQLTSRLAQKIAPDSSTKGKKKEKDTDVDSNGNEEQSAKKPKTTIENNSDLLAILEGDDDLVEMPQLSNPQNKESTPTDETNLKNLEREIALQQLQDLPYLSPKTKFIKGHNPLKVNMTLKTYSRKRKSTDPADSVVTPVKKNIVDLTPEEGNKDNMESPGSVYVTKSSRVIKKKVVWDPDDTPTKSKLTTTKPEISAVQTKTPQKSVQVKNEVKSAELRKPVIEPKTKVEKKVEEKLPVKKTTINIEKRTSPNSAKSALKHKKGKSELDRLLGDEGAIKMLYDLNNADSPVDEKRRKNVISVEKTFKDLAKKANQIKSELVNNTSISETKSLRKKESGTSPVSPPKPVTAVVPGGISRQKSKDSARSTPPPSPAFSYPNENSCLIRRRSSSSISSGNDTGGSLERDSSEGKVNKKRPLSTSTDPLKIKKTKKNSEMEKLQKKAENRIGHFNTLTFKKANKGVIIDLYTGSDSKCYFTSELLDELSTVLQRISKEKDCNVVLIRSSKSTVFSKGLDYTSLIADKESARKTKALELADRIRKFIQCLIEFPKVLIAGIQGECVGLAVTMLPLFDIVIASDDAKFSTNYSSLGCPAEGGFLLTVPHVFNYGLAGELLYASQTLTADEAVRRGLISKICWPEKYQDTIKSTLTAVAQGSKQSLEATKKQLRCGIKERSKEVLDSMVKDLVEYWTSSECQSNFAAI